jgi:hypothetical protein
MLSTGCIELGPIDLEFIDTADLGFARALVATNVALIA